MKPQVFWALYVFCFADLMAYIFSDSIVMLANLVDIRTMLLVLQASALTLLGVVALYLLRKLRAKDSQ